MNNKRVAPIHRIRFGALDAVTFVLVKHETDYAGGKVFSDSGPDSSVQAATVPRSTSCH